MREYDYDNIRLNEHLATIAIAILHEDISSGQHRVSISNRSAIDKAIKEVKHQASVFGVVINPEDIDEDHIFKELNKARTWI